MWSVLFLAVGGALGTLARYGLNGLVSNHQPRQFGLPAIFPLGTMIINVTGCFVIGLLAAMSDPSLGRTWLKTGWRDFLMVGFCGGYTTFSSYGLQTLNLARDGEWFFVAANVIGSNALGLIAVYVGWVAGRFLQAKLHGGSI
jgi:CrcB protein